MRSAIRAAFAGLLALAPASACEEDSVRETPPPVVEPSTHTTDPPPIGSAEQPEPEAPPSRDVDDQVACVRHEECRLLVGVCGIPTPSNAASVEATQRQIEARSRITTCGVTGMRVEDATPACVEGACTALLGPPAEHECAVDEDCVVADGLCGPTEAIRRTAGAAFETRVEEMKSRGISCGYGARPETVTAACDDGLCVARTSGA